MDKSFSETYLDFKQINPEVMNQAILDALYMTLISMVLVTTIGLVLGLIPYSIGRRSRPYARVICEIVSIISNIFRSTPFMILMVLVIPFARAIISAMLGVQAAIPALVLSAAPFYARLVEIAFREVNPSVLEATDAIGASYWEIIWKVLIPESIPALISGLTVTTISMIEFTAAAGTIGAGGLGDLAWQEGYQRGNLTVTFVVTLVILLTVFIVQGIGDSLTRKTGKR